MSSNSLMFNTGAPSDLVVMPCQGRTLDAALKVGLAIAPDFRSIFSCAGRVNCGGVWRWATFSSAILCARARCFMKALTVEWIKKAEGDFNYCLREDALATIATVACHPADPRLPCVQL